MKFSEFGYQRPDIKDIQTRYQALLDKLESAPTPQAMESLMADINKLRIEFGSMGTIAAIRHSINTADEFYKSEQAYFDQTGPLLGQYETRYYALLIKSQHRAWLENKVGKHLFVMAELALKVFKPEIVPDLQMENKLSTEYTALLASARIMFEGQERTLSQMGPFLISPDRQMRQKAAKAKYGFLSSHEAELDELYDKLVKIRVAIAHKLGYKNFVQLGYDRMGRSDYDAKMVANFRKQVKEFIVPIASGLRERQRVRLGLDKLKYFDEGLNFQDGNAKPKGDPDWIINNGRAMYSELSPETKEFFDFMLDNELMDLVSKPNKAGGGYCTFIGKYKAPFIFSNFNGTSGDIDVLTHEAGHAFQAYATRDFTVPEYQSPTSEAAEIHSMSMEFFTWPWMEKFFKEDVRKYRFGHLNNAMLFIPYGVTVDEFQHFVYENPNATPAERKKQWRAIEQKYLPHRDYEDNQYLANGGFWHQQLHIFKHPFYYIDYTLAEICAFQFWKKSLEDRASAWADYVRLCQTGGRQAFVGLTQVAKLISPFQDGCVKSVVGTIKTWLDDNKW
ncbi:MAG TPA: M3 family oligoendopeptidase [Planctomycetota bacterium]|nr:M3 family oligoendopeptidase [Planctomycetota bacterium]